MEKQLEAIRDQQKSTWNEFSPMLKKWDDILMDAAMPLTTISKWRCEYSSKHPCHCR
ncbi:MAG: hypothetical protein KDC06_05740 [Chitinophagaceae bacterium]|nr:hypothetical protein [Chitinophagaceae bacterium]